METKEKRAPGKSAGGSANKQQRKPAARTRTRKPAKPEPPKVTPDVVYLAPKPFNRSRFLLRLITVAAVVVALVLGMSVFFKVEEFSVSGMEKYSAYDISQASGIEKGANLLLLNRTEAGARIKALLPYVKRVRVGIELPGTVHIVIEELDVTYAIKDSNGSWWLMSAEGIVVEELKSDSHHTKILGVQLQDPKPGAKAKALETATEQTDPEGNPIPVTITAADRLSTVVDILEYLEKEKVVGEADSVDVNNMGDIQIWYGDKYQVKLGDQKNLGSKVYMMMASIRSLEQERPYDRGVLNITDPNDIYFDSFE